MTPRGRAALVLGVVLLVGATLAATAIVRVGQHECGSALSAHAPQGRFIVPGTQSSAEDRCDRKVTRRRWFVVFLGGIGLVIAMGGAADQKKPS
jgi:hypothetical protein